MEWCRGYFCMDGRALIVKDSLKKPRYVFWHHLKSFNSVWWGMVVFGHQVDVLSICSYYVTYAFQNESTLYS